MMAGLPAGDTAITIGGKAATVVKRVTTYDSKPVQPFFDGGTRQYLVSKMLQGFTDPTFKPGAVVTSWSGVPIDRAVEVNADRQAGSNPDARHARIP